MQHAFLPIFHAGRMEWAIISIVQKNIRARAFICLDSDQRYHLPTHQLMLNALQAI